MPATSSTEARTALTLSTTIPTTVSNVSKTVSAVTYDIVDATNTRDSITVAADREYVFGNGGDDEIYIGRLDTLSVYGGAGNDLFQITTQSGTGSSTIDIGEFGTHDDRIDLSQLGFTSIDQLDISYSGNVATIRAAAGQPADRTINIVVYGSEEKFITRDSFIFSGQYYASFFARTELNLGASSDSVSARTVSISGIARTIQDGTNEADTVEAGDTTYAAFGNDGDDTISMAFRTKAAVYGGIGHDRFVISASDSGANPANAAAANMAIKDFEIGKDKINFSAFADYDSFSDLTLTSSFSASTNLLTSTITLKEGIVGEADVNLIIYSYGNTKLASTSFLFNGQTEDTIPAETETFTGSGAADTLEGGEEGDRVIGGGGADDLSGAGGNDTIYGGRGISDTLDGADSVLGGLGADLIFGNSGNDVIYGDDTLAADTDGNDNIYGGIGLDTIYGGGGADLLAGGGGIAHPTDDADRIYGGLGGDVILGNGGNDLLVAGSQANDITDTAENFVFGGAGNDVIYGAAGRDYLAGQTGDDTLTGGKGNDIFVFFADSGFDVIADFSTGSGTNGNDRIYISNTIAGITGFSSITQTFVGGDLVLSFGTGNTITLDNVTSVSQFNVFVTDTNSMLSQFMTAYNGLAISLS